MSSNNNNNNNNNKRWIYNSRPKAEATEENFKLVVEEMPQLTAEKNILVKSVYVSVDPYLRIQMSSKPTWEAPRETGDTQLSAAVCVVIKSNNDEFKEGMYVETYTGWALYSVVSANDISKIDIDPTLSPSLALSALGMPGRTAYFGLLDVCEPKQGEVLVVSAASGAVGSLVCQIGKIYGCFVIGIAGRDDKIKYLKELGVDEAINYKTCGNILDALTKACNGRKIDCYFDNVGGEITDAVFELINNFARIGICGQISQYNTGLEDEKIMGPRFLHKLIYTRAKIQGLLSRDFKPKHQEMVEQMSKWIKSNKIIARETIFEGFEQLPNALTAMMNGANIGKMIVKIE